MAAKRLLLQQPRISSGALLKCIFVGSYTGDGNATQAITGIGFQPRFLMIYSRNAVLLTKGWKFDTDALLAYFRGQGDQAWLYSDDYIISLDADGFTVGDGTGHPYGNMYNLLAIAYTYIAWA